MSRKQSKWTKKLINLNLSGQIAHQHVQCLIPIYISEQRKVLWEFMCCTRTQSSGSGQCLNAHCLIHNKKSKKSCQTLCVLYLIPTPNISYLNETLHQTFKTWFVNGTAFSPKLATRVLFLDLMDLVFDSTPLSVPPKITSSFHRVFWATL